MIDLDIVEGMEKLSALEKRLELLETVLLSNNPSHINREQVRRVLTTFTLLDS